MKQHSIELQFPIKEIKPRTDLGDKFIGLGISSTICRLIVDMELVDASNKPLLTIDAILDTGAGFSLLPRSIMRKYPGIKTIPHTVWGIVDTPDCTVKAEIGKIGLIIKDPLGKRSPVLEVPVAFVDLETAPHLLGMKGILEKAKICIDYSKKLLSLIFS